MPGLERPSNRGCAVHNPIRNPLALAMGRFNKAQCKPCPKNKPVRLKGVALVRLMKKVCERDNWTCQDCGATTNLECRPHHIRYGRDKEDTMDNLVLLCIRCHGKRHSLNKII